MPMEVRLSQGSIVAVAELVAVEVPRINGWLRTSVGHYSDEGRAIGFRTTISFDIADVGRMKGTFLPERTF